MERDSLKAMEDDELVTRGSDYIEDIAKVFEARYYIVILVSATSAFGFEVGSIWLGILLGALSFALGALLMGRQRLGDVVTIEAAPVVVQGRDIYVGDIFIMNLGLVESREIIQDHALGAVLVPKDDDARGTIASPGQRQAIVHDAATVLGARKDSDTPEFTPMAKRDLKTGRVGVYIVPMEKDQEALLEALRRVPVLESARGAALKTRAGVKARKGRNRGEGTGWKYYPEACAQVIRTNCGEKRSSQESNLYIWRETTVKDSRRSPIPCPHLPSPRS